VVAGVAEEEEKGGDVQERGVMEEGGEGVKFPWREAGPPNHHDKEGGKEEAGDDGEDGGVMEEGEDGRSPELHYRYVRNRLQGFGFRVSGFWFRVSGFGFRDLVAYLGLSFRG